MLEYKLLSENAPYFLIDCAVFAKSEREKSLSEYMENRICSTMHFVLP